jgi:hypothetical protein
MYLYVSAAARCDPLSPGPDGRVAGPAAAGRPAGCRPQEGPPQVLILPAAHPGSRTCYRALAQRPFADLLAARLATTKIQCQTNRLSRAELEAVTEDLGARPGPALGPGSLITTFSLVRTLPRPDFTASPPGGPPGPHWLAAAVSPAALRRLPAAEPPAARLLPTQPGQGG